MRNNIQKRRRFREKHDPLFDIEREQGIELPGKYHDLAQPEIELFKKKRGREKEIYGQWRLS
jgi:hypothetical protein